MRLSNTTMIHGICTRWYRTSTNSLTQVCAQRNLSRLILSLIAFPCLVCTYEIPLLRGSRPPRVTIDLRQKAGNSVNKCKIYNRNRPSSASNFRISEQNCSIYQQCFKNFDPYFEKFYGRFIKKIKQTMYHFLVFLLFFHYGEQNQFQRNASDLGKSKIAYQGRLLSSLFVEMFESRQSYYKETTSDTRNSFLVLKNLISIDYCKEKQG